MTSTINRETDDYAVRSARTWIVINRRKAIMTDELIQIWEKAVTVYPYLKLNLGKSGETEEKHKIFARMASRLPPC
jgi:hypothetical protein